MPRFLPPSATPIPLRDVFAGLSKCMGTGALNEFRKDICQYFGVRNCYFASSGRAALSLVLQSLHRLDPKRDEVLLPAFTSFSVPSAVAHAGLKISLYDLDRATLSPDIESLRMAVNDRSLCMVVCHLYGYPCDMDNVMQVADQFGLPVIDDAAQAMGATFAGQPVGTFGEAGLFSLSRGKNISTVDGGILVTNSPRIAAELERRKLAPVGIDKHLSLVFRSAVLSIMLHPQLYGIPAKISSLKLGASFFNPEFPENRLTSFQAGIGRRMLRRLKSINASRRLKAALLARELSSQVILPQIVPTADPVFLRLPVYVSNAAAAARINRGIVRSYPAPLNEIDPLKPFLANQGTFPNAANLSRQIVTLPTHRYLNAADIREIAASISRSN
jgi:perosamine synthetase